MSLAVSHREHMSVPYLEKGYIHSYVFLRIHMTTQNTHKSPRTDTRTPSFSPYTSSWGPREAHEGFPKQTGQARKMKGDRQRERKRQSERQRQGKKALLRPPGDPAQKQPLQAGPCNVESGSAQAKSCWTHLLLCDPGPEPLWVAPAHECSSAGSDPPMLGVPDSPSRPGSHLFPHPSVSAAALQAPMVLKDRPHYPRSSPKSRTECPGQLPSLPSQAPHPQGPSPAINPSTKAEGKVWQ